MAIFKIAICPVCKRQSRRAKPAQSVSCPKCGVKMAYLENWYFSIQVSGRKVVRVAGPAKKDAKDMEARLRIEVRSGEFFKKTQEVPWSKAVEYFQTWCKQNISVGTQRVYDISLKILSNYFSTYTLNEITLREVERFKKARSNMAAATVNLNLSTLKRLFSLSEEWGLIDSNPIARVKLLPLNNARERYLTEEEEKKLLAECRNKISFRRYLQVLMPLETGLRKEGVLGIKRADINLKDGLITRKTKGDKVTKIPITSRLKDALTEYYSGPQNLSRCLFPLKSDSRRPEAQVYWFKSACARVGIKDFTFHDLRHTFATNFLRRTKDISTLQEILGHSSRHMTERYAHVLDESIREGMKKFEMRDNVVGINR